ncbi:MAG TPA: hypothetical protein VMM15_17485 [Bradyrhizobium sp.]|nr:hypothetical protein [Bradyrhizobium sp.]
MTATSTIGAAAGVSTSLVADVKAVVTASSLLMQAVIVPADKTKEGRLIEAVTLPWFEIVKWLKAAPNSAFQIPPRQCRAVPGKVRHS